MKNSVLIVEAAKKSARKKGTADVIMAAFQEKAADELSPEMHVDLCYTFINIWGICRTM